MSTSTIRFATTVQNDATGKSWFSCDEHIERYPAPTRSNVYVDPEPSWASHYPNSHEADSRRCDICLEDAGMTAETFQLPRLSPSGLELQVPPWLTDAKIGTLEDRLRSHYMEQIQRTVADVDEAQATQIVADAFRRDVGWPVIARGDEVIDDEWLWDQGCRDDSDHARIRPSTMMQETINRVMADPKLADAL